MNPETMDAGREQVILIADDDILVRRVVERTVSGPGRRVLVAGSGEAAVAAARKLRPDLIILDVMMPGLTGHQACRLLRGREDTRFIPILMLTGLGAPEEEASGLDQGADDYAVKPFQAADLQARVRALLRRPRVGPPALTPPSS